jgi:ubiquinone biosynthesis protein COQ9
VSEKPHKTEDDHLAIARTRLCEAALPHVPFDGWSEACFKAALQDADIDTALARLSCPRGALDLALAYHKSGDAEMATRMKGPEFAALRYSAKVAAAVRFRLEAATDKEVVRKGMTFFAMPAHASEGAAAIWRTCDLIWNTLGDTSDDLNWYSKRTILSAVYSSTLLFWLGDNSAGHAATWEFLDRRIANVMQFEKLKSSLRKNPLFNGFLRGPGQILDRIKAPAGSGNIDLPGHITQQR